MKVQHLNSFEFTASQISYDFNLEIVVKYSTVVRTRKLQVLSNGSHLYELLYYCVTCELSIPLVSLHMMLFSTWMWFRLAISTLKIVLIDLYAPYTERERFNYSL